jgi:hypothetical protein
MALHLYRRHGLSCEGGHAEDSCSSELDERRKGWRRCGCVIHLSGTLAGKFRRRATNKTTWDDARAFVAAVEATGTWDATALAASPAARILVPAPEPEPSGAGDPKAAPSARRVG